MTQTFLITSARDAHAATATGLPCAFLCYRIGPNGALQRAMFSGSCNGGLLGIFDAPGLLVADLEQLSQTIAAECRSKLYAGVLFDFQIQDNAQDAFASLCTNLQQRSIPVFFPHTMAAAVPKSRVILPGSLSGGTFDEMLEQYTTQYALPQICLDLQRCRHSFTMPSNSPDGQPLMPQELQALLQQYQPKVFFSPELCTNYFTYRPPDQPFRFVLFDDPDTAAQRLRRATDYGVRSCFLLYSEWGSDAKHIVTTALFAEK